MPRVFFRPLLLAVALLAAFRPVLAQDDWDKELAARRRGCDALFAAWRRARLPQVRARLNGELVRAAIRAERPGYVEEVAADGRLTSKELRLPRRARVVPLRELRTFDINTLSNEEDGYAPSVTSNAGWLVRRITRDAWEVWTPTHGWLFDGTGRMLNEARPARADPDATGREWFGAFLPDGRWVTTDLEEMDRTLTFYSRDGQRTRQMAVTDLAPRDPKEPCDQLLGWARSDRDGAAWIVNVGSEEGYATVRVEPEGPARVLDGIERWQLCHPRALGPRGWYISMDVPDDAGQTVLNRRSPGHGPYVGFASYSLEPAGAFSLRDFPEYKTGEENRAVDAPVDHVTLPDGNDLFGFWPGGENLFIGTETMDETRRPRKNTGELPMMNKTWFFDRQWKLQGWTRARRLADAADGRSLLLRTDSDSRIVTLGPDRHVVEVRRFAWPGGETADTVTLFDDLRLGLFVRHGKLVLAGW